MRTNKAPEKIFLIRNIPTPTSLNTINDCHEKYLPEWYEVREKDSDIEYTRTDAFIKKACKYLFENYHGEKPSLEMIEQFKNYMKGE